MARKHFAFDNSGGNTPNRKHRKGKVSFRNKNEAISNPVYVPAVDSTGKFIIVSDSNSWRGRSTASATPIFFASEGNNTQDLIDLVNGLRSEKRLSQVNTVSDALDYCNSQNLIVLNQDEIFPTATTDGLIFNLDVSIPASYTNGANTWDDVINPAYSASVIGDVTYGGDFGGVLNVSGYQTSDYIILPHDVFNNLSSSTAWSLECWMRLDNTSGTTYLFSTATESTSNGWIIQKQGSRLYPWNETLQDGIGIPFSSGETLCVTLVVNGSSIYLYKNGLYKARYSYQKSIVNSVGWVLNQEQDGTLGGFDASQATDMGVYSLRVYDKVLTSTEILDNFNVHKERFGL